MNITCDLLKRWGACGRGLEWFRKEGYTDGVALPLSEIKKRIPKEHPEYWYWLLARMAAHKNDQEGIEAYTILKKQGNIKKLDKSLEKISESGNKTTRKSV